MEISQDELFKKAQKCINDISMSKWGDKLFINDSINVKLLGKLAPSVAKRILETGKIKIQQETSQSDSEGNSFQQSNGSSANEIEIDEIRISEDGEVIIPQSPEGFVKFVIEYMFNEFDAINNAINNVYQGLHDDRVALVISAVTKYKKALNTNDEKIRLATIRSAEDTLTDALAQISKEVASNADKLSEIPKSLLKKLFCGVKPEQAEAWINQSRESLLVYEQGLHLMVRLDMEMKEPNRIIPSLLEAKEFLENSLQNNKGQRMYELSGDYFWIEKPNEIIGKINEVQQALLEGKQIISIERAGCKL